MTLTSSILSTLFQDNMENYRQKFFLFRGVNFTSVFVASMPEVKERKKR